MYDYPFTGNSPGNLAVCILLPLLCGLGSRFASFFFLQSKNLNSDPLALTDNKREAFPDIAEILPEAAPELIQSDSQTCRCHGSSHGSPGSWGPTMGPQSPAFTFVPMSGDVNLSTGLEGLEVLYLPKPHVSQAFPY